MLPLYELPRLGQVFPAIGKEGINAKAELDGEPKGDQISEGAGHKWVKGQCRGIISDITVMIQSSPAKAAPILGFSASGDFGRGKGLSCVSNPNKLLL